MPGAEAAHCALWLVLQFCKGYGVAWSLNEAECPYHWHFWHDARLFLQLVLRPCIVHQHLLSLFLSFILPYHAQGSRGQDVLYYYGWRRVFQRNEAAVVLECLPNSSISCQRSLDKFSLGQEALAPILWISKCSSGAWDNRKQMSLEWYTHALSLTT